MCFIVTSILLWWTLLRNTTFKLEDVKNILRQGISGITPEDLRKCIMLVKKQGENMWDLNVSFDRIIVVCVPAIVLFTVNFIFQCSFCSRFYFIYIFYFYNTYTLWIFCFYFDLNWVVLHYKEMHQNSLPLSGVETRIHAQFKIFSSQNLSFYNKLETC